MSLSDIWLLALAAVFTVVAGGFSSADAALSSFSKARAEEIAAQGRSGSSRLLVIVEDPPRYLNTALFLRMLTETAAIVLVTVVVLDLIVPRGGSESGPKPDGDRWWAMLLAIGIMVVVSFVVIGVVTAHRRPAALRAHRAARRRPADRLHQGARSAATAC